MRPIIIILSTLATLYLAIATIVYAGQRRLLYLPNTSTELAPYWKEVKDATNKTVALEYNQSVGNEQMVIIFHGNGGNANERGYFTQLFPHHHLVVAQYPGYGQRFGEEISKEALVDSSKTLVQMMQKQGKKIILVGESLGTGIAAQVASDMGIENLLLLTPYSSIKDVAQHRYPWLPVSWLLKDDFDSIKALENFHGKVVMIMAGQDQVVPVKFALQLRDSLLKNGKATLQELMFPQAHHHNAIGHLSPSEKQKIWNFFR